MRQPVKCLAVAALAAFAASAAYAQETQAPWRVVVQNGRQIRRALEWLDIGQIEEDGRPSYGAPSMDVISGGRLLVGVMGYEVAVFDIADARIVFVARLPEPAHTVAGAPDGATIAASTGAGRTYLITVADALPDVLIEDAGGSLAFDATGRYLAVFGRLPQPEGSKSKGRYWESPCDLGIYDVVKRAWIARADTPVVTGYCVAFEGRAAVGYGLGGQPQMHDPSAFPCHTRLDPVTGKTTTAKGPVNTHRSTGVSAEPAEEPYAVPECIEKRRQALRDALRKFREAASRVPLWSGGKDLFAAVGEDERFSMAVPGVNLSVRGPRGTGAWGTAVLSVAGDGGISVTEPVGFPEDIIQGCGSRLLAIGHKRDGTALIIYDAKTGQQVVEFPWTPAGGREIATRIVQREPTGVFGQYRVRYHVQYSPEFRNTAPDAGGGGRGPAPAGQSTGRRGVFPRGTFPVTPVHEDRDVILYLAPDWAMTDGDLVFYGLDGGGKLGSIGGGTATWYPSLWSHDCSRLAFVHEDEGWSTLTVDVVEAPSAKTLGCVRIADCDCPSGYEVAFLDRDHLAVTYRRLSDMKRFLEIHDLAGGKRELEVEGFDGGFWTGDIGDGRWLAETAAGVRLLTQDGQWGAPFGQRTGWSRNGRVQRLPLKAADWVLGTAEDEEAILDLAGNTEVARWLSNGPSVVAFGGRVLVRGVVYPKVEGSLDHKTIRLGEVDFVDLETMKTLFTLHPGVGGTMTTLFTGHPGAGGRPGWIATTPDGFWDASPGAEGYVTVLRGLRIADEDATRARRREGLVGKALMSVRTDRD